MPISLLLCAAAVSAVAAITSAIIIHFIIIDFTNGFLLLLGLPKDCYLVDIQCAAYSAFKERTVLA